MPRTRPRFAIRMRVAAVAVSLSAALGGCALLADVTTPTTESDERATGEVASITDGDTLRLVVNGEELRVRLTGIDTPELRESECFADEARDALAALAPVGSRIAFEYDDERRDQYDRELMYLYAADGTFINLALVEGGYARELHYSPNYHYRDQIESAEAAAQAAAAGLWGACS
ncbi:micrococcal nuclease [Microcella putealis]|uniref:Micrococcal nuclease n=1 Tax=Microcella putealis TaxID=337005 RepID=A0A4Q7LQA4_9MICO|nr:thermonuclease family protein [Microcella putealis]RZS56423.1 micrococcal nuclease [Microcella putealis]TQM27091.1 micrococcal nuclease [Microcella putealis]